VKAKEFILYPLSELHGLFLPASAIFLALSSGGSMWLVSHVLQAVLYSTLEESRFISPNCGQVSW
jgi:hypothetical protein